MLYTLHVCFSVDYIIFIVLGSGKEESTVKSIFYSKDNCYEEHYFIER